MRTVEIEPYGKPTAAHAKARDAKGSKSRVIRPKARLSTASTTLSKAHPVMSELAMSELAMSELAMSDLAMSDLAMSDLAMSDLAMSGWAQTVLLQVMPGSR